MATGEVQAFDYKRLQREREDAVMARVANAAHDIARLAFTLTDNSSEAEQACDAAISLVKAVGRDGRDQSGRRS